MKQHILRIVWGAVSVTLYLLLVFLLFFYFNHRNQESKKHYVKKDEHRIQVAIAAASPKVPAPKKKKAVKPKPKPAPKKKAKAKKKRETKKKRVLKEKVTKKRVKKRDRNVTRPKKQTKDLFAQIKAKKKPLIRVTDKPVVSTPKKKLFEMVEAKPSANRRPNRSLKQQKQYESGVEDAYLAHVQEMLEGWPAQSDFAGEKVKVHLKIDPTGHFEFVIKRRSQNPAFNRALSDYLIQLQEFGFGPHKGSRTYLFEAEFVAKE